MLNINIDTEQSCKECKIEAKHVHTFMYLISDDFSTVRQQVHQSGYTYSVYTR